MGFRRTMSAKAYANSGCKLQLKIIAKTNFCTNLVIQKKQLFKGVGTKLYSSIFQSLKSYAT